jgi:hypothetical protein
LIKKTRHGENPRKNKAERKPWEKQGREKTLGKTW